MYIWLNHIVSEIKSTRPNQGNHHHHQAFFYGYCMKKYPSFFGFRLIHKNCDVDRFNSMHSFNRFFSNQPCHPYYVDKKEKENISPHFVLASIHSYIRFIQFIFNYYPNKNNPPTINIEIEILDDVEPHTNIARVYCSLFSTSNIFGGHS